ncbi:organic hydroperoxide resistance protein OhrR [Niveibacterium umoris]|uniref:Ohr subfamily peroxiredoxin n=1 Tax=Niveibacterium umoris TaxID=1193620 RepID=A0A840BWK1_9RHOO|nr:organic hydroperoxide resistance protein [Niveibacterium umoris]MBB4014687.1 Ohr subfamily peroxiredoxin [Niveibacterium umoris]
MKTLYTAVATATGGREGRAVSSDGALDVTLALPRELGGSGKLATNPEQLFAAGYSACFENAIRHVARAAKINITESSVTGRVGIGANASGGFVLSAALEVSLPGLDRDTAQTLIAKAHEVCPYSNATRGNLDVQITLL